MSNRLDIKEEIMSKTNIEWTESTWNPATGCTKISAGCKNCYAEKMAKRLQAMRQPNYINGFQLTLQPQMLNIPLKTKKPTTWFVNSMSDLFHKDIPLEYIQQVFDVMAKADWHTFQVLTKRSDRVAELSNALNWSKNVWMGVSVEDKKNKFRIDDLRQTEAQTRFLSLEPLLEDLGELDLTGIDWVIVGGESGHDARPMNPDWVRNIQLQSAEQDVSFFFKQWGGVNKKKTGRTLDGRTWDAMPKQK